MWLESKVLDIASWIYKRGELSRSRRGGSDIEKQRAGVIVTPTRRNSENISSDTESIS